MGLRRRGVGTSNPALGDQFGKVFEGTVHGALGIIRKTASGQLSML